MKESQRLKIHNLAYRLDLLPETIARQIEDGVSVSDDPRKIDYALAAAELMLEEFADKLAPFRIWDWFLTPIPALAGQSLMQVSIQNGLEPVKGYIERIRFGDYS